MNSEININNNDRHDPNLKMDYLSIQHVERYMFACRMLRDEMRVLDVACGTGYGTNLIREKGCQVIGVDIDNQQINLNQATWSECQFRHGDVLQLPFEENSFDAVVSFETLEHVTDGDRFFSEIKRVLQPNGLLICSTPNIKYTSHPAFHLKEYTPGEFWVLVARYFNTSDRYGQYFRRSDQLKDNIRKFARYVVKNSRLRDSLKQIRHWISRQGADSTREELQQTNTTFDHEDGAVSPYRVIPFTTEKLLRIMCVVAWNAESLNKDESKFV